VAQHWAQAMLLLVKNGGKLVGQVALADRPDEGFV